MGRGRDEPKMCPRSAGSFRLAPGVLELREVLDAPRDVNQFRPIKKRQKLTFGTKVKSNREFVMSPSDMPDSDPAGPSAAVSSWYNGLSLPLCAYLYTVV